MLPALVSNQGCANRGSASSELAKAMSPCNCAPSLWNESRIDVNDLVITVLFSSAHGSVKTCVHKCPKGDAVLQVTPKVRTSLRCRNNFAASILWVVSSENEKHRTRV